MKVKIRYVDHMWEAYHTNIEKVGKGLTAEEAYYDLYGMRATMLKKRKATKEYVYGQRGL